MNTEAIAKLTAKGRELMTSIGKQELSFFDNGVTAGSGSYGEVIAGDFGFANPRSAAGVLGGLVKQGLMTADEAEGDGGLWYELTELGAEVANHLAGNTEEQAEEPQSKDPSVGVTIKAGRKWSYLYAADGSLIAEVRNDQLEAIWKTLKYA